MTLRNIGLCLACMALGIGMGTGGALCWLNVDETQGDGVGLPPVSLQATVYLPLNDNQGRPFPTKKWQSALQILLNEFGGATLLAAREGYWVDGKNRIVREPVRPAQISFDRKLLQRFRRCVRQTGRLLGQESMYVTFEEARIEIMACVQESPKKLP